MRVRFPKKVDPVYNSRRWRAVREFALQRDLYRCVICGADVSAKGAARVDHIKTVKDYPELAHDVDNLRTLCTLHDRHAHRERSGFEQGPDTQRIERFEFKGVDRQGWPIGGV